MEFIYPPDYQYSLVHLFIILYLSGIMLYLGHRVEKRKLISDSNKTGMALLEDYLLNLVFTLIILGSLYFFALPSYL